MAPIEQDEDREPDAGPLVLWNHRWEYDEAPDAFLPILPGNIKDGCRNGYVSGSSQWDPVTGLGPLNVAAALRYIDSNIDMFADL